MKKIVMSIAFGYGDTLKNQIRMLKDIGFDGFFTGWGDGENIQEMKALADELGMIYQSVHAPFTKMADIWHGDDEAADIAVNELIECACDCAENNIPIMVVHAFIGFELHAPNELGIKRLERLVKKAEELKIKLAFENTEGEEYLAEILKAYGSYDCVGFCWDTGHEMCYNRSVDLINLYGDKLIATHLNDNLGISDKDGKITWLDDLHLLPFDGVADWENIAGRIKKCGYKGELTFELNRTSKPERHENDKYAAMPLDEYFKEVYKRAVRIAKMCE